MCHNIISCKLRSFGFEGNRLLWFISFLSNKTILTLVGSTLCSSDPLPSGVVQGIGSLLFVLHVNDVEKNSSNSATTKLFADDLKLCTEL